MRTTGAGEGKLGMRGTVSENEPWECGFRDFMRGTSVVRDETIDAYIGYIEIVSNKLGMSVEELAGNYERLEETIKRIYGTAEWKRKTKDNYKTAVNRLSSYLSSRAGEADDNVSSGDTLSISDSGTSSSTNMKSQKVGVAGKRKSESALLAQINTIEEMVREHEDKTWNSVFKCVSAYALGMPSIIIALGVNKFGYLLVIVSAIFAFGGVATLVPVLRRPSRQLNEILEYGERLHFEGRQSGCIHPAHWTLFEKVAVALTVVSLAASLVFLGLAKVAG